MSLIDVTGVGTRWVQYSSPAVPPASRPSQCDRARAAGLSQTKDA